MKPNSIQNIIKVSARAFTNPFQVHSVSPLKSNVVKVGGNPVTIFHFPSNPHNETPSSNLPTSQIRTELAKSCPWESVMTYSNYPYTPFGSHHVENDISHNVNKSNATWNRIWFYMPSGEEVSFCAHAAMAACSVIQTYEHIDNDCNDRETNNVIHFLSGILNDEEEQDDEMKQRKLIPNQAFVRLVTSSSNVEEDHDSGTTKWIEVSLQMPSTLDESEILNKESLMKLLSEIGLHENDIMREFETNDERIHDLPSCINSSVARKKTLIPVKSESILHSATNPKDASYFRDLCDDIDSTGLYLYTPQSTLSSSSLLLPSLSSFECRQFPRYSGYPEDPATGIAAAALANSLYNRNIHDDDDDGTATTTAYEIFQGTAMGKPSRIQICFDSDNDDVLICSGVVEIDEVHPVQ